MQSKMERLHEKYEEKCKKYDDLARQFDALKDFVSANVGCSVSAPSTTALPDPSPRTPVHRESTDYTVVRSRTTPTNKKFLPITTYNRLKVLSEEEEDAIETRIVGDSIVRGQISEFCGRARKTRKRFCMPGGRLDDITAACDEAVRGAEDNALFVLHAGTNDVLSTRSEELMEKYKRMIQRYKNKSHNIIISGILPRTKAPTVFYDRAFSINSRLRSLCTEEEVDYVNLWDDFYNKPFLFQEDGLHLNEVGAARLGRLLSNKVSSFRPKNSQEDRTAST